MIPSSHEIEEELRHHIEARAADLEKRGRTPRQALREARIEFGSLARFVEEGREAKGWRTLDLFASSIAAAGRFLRRNPPYALLSSLSLALAIGTVTLLFSIARGVLDTPLPYPNADRLYNVRIVAPAYAAIHANLPISARHFAEWRNHCKLCETIALIDGGTYELPDDPHRVNALQVTPEFFQIIGEKAQQGRLFHPGEEGPAHPRVAVLTDRFWRTRANADPSIVGRSLLLNGSPTQVVGILPPGLPLPHGEQLGEMMQFPRSIDILLPSLADAAKQASDHFQWSALLKLRPGVTSAEGQAELNRLLAPLAKSAGLEMHAELVPLHQQITEQAQCPVRLLAAAAAILLLIVCANFANLQLARTASRRKELAVHATLGASRAALLRHILSETAVLVAIAGIAGLLLAAAGLWLLRLWGPQFLPRIEEVAVHRLYWAIATTVTAVVGIVSVLTPLWRIWWRVDTQPVLVTSRQRLFADGPGERQLRNGLLSLAAASSLTLACVAALLLLSYDRIRRGDLGFSTEQLSTFHVSPPQAITDPATRRQMHHTLLSRLRTFPGVQAVGSTNRLPLLGETWIHPIQRQTGPFQGPMGNWRYVSTGYFAAAGTPLLVGREFNDTDRGQRVAIISERVAKALFPAENPLGQVILQHEKSSTFPARIVGVAANVKAKHIESEPPFMVYLPDWYGNGDAAFYVLRATGNRKELLTSAQDQAAELEMILPTEWIVPMQRFVDLATESRRWQTLWTTLFAALGGLTACAALFGVVFFQVSRRTTEIAVRMALGATRAQTALFLLRESMQPIWLGLLAGTAATLALSDQLHGHLYGVTLADSWWVYLGTAAIQALAALAAAYLSVLRAVNIEPAQALKID